MESIVRGGCGEHSSKVIIACLLCVFLIGCAHFENIKTSFQPECVQLSIFSATTMIKKGFPAVIAIQETGKPGVYHAQTLAYVHGEWRWIQVLLNESAVGMRECGKVVEYWTVQQAIDISMGDLKNERYSGIDPGSRNSP